MFAPQTNPASPAVLLSHKQMFIRCTSIRDVLALPINLFPVYQLFLAASCWCRKTLVLGFMSPSSRVGQQPRLLYRANVFGTEDSVPKTFAKSLAISLCYIADPIPPSAKATGFLGVFL
jgi:hypothetical protein